MAEVIQFGAVHYNTDKVPNISSAVCPPYDMIDESTRKKLIEHDPYNFVSLILPDGEGEEKYRGAMHKIFSWILRDVFQVDVEPSFYIYEVEFKFEGKVEKRTGFVGLLKIEEYGENVRKHEKTFDKYVEDRYLLLKETQTELEDIFFLYKDDQKRIASEIEKYTIAQDASIVVQDEEGNTHSLYKIGDPVTNDLIKEVMKENTVYIADGHHRYETSLRFMKEMKEELGDKYKGTEQFNYSMGAFFNVHDEGIKILPTHRLVKELTLPVNEFFNKLGEIYNIGAMQFKDARQERAARIKLRHLLTQYRENGKQVFGLYLKQALNKYFVLSLKDGISSPIKSEGSEDFKNLDVLLLQDSILGSILNVPVDEHDGQVFYVRGDNKALDMVKAGEFSAAFILNPVDPIQVINVANNNEVMPHKSTDFYPKLLSGLTAFSLRYSKTKS